MKDILKSLLIMEGFPEDKAYWLVEDIFKQVIVEHDHGLPKDKKEALVSSGKMSREDFVTVVMRYIQSTHIYSTDICNLYSGESFIIRCSLFLKV